MKKIFFAVISAAILFSCASKKEENKTGNDAGTEKTAGASDTKKPEPKPDSATMMKNWQEYMTPGEVHKMMAKWDGNWADDITMWMYPDAPAQKTTSTTTNKMVMNGLYQESDHVGNMMGMPFHGKGTLAYDIHKKMFVSTWIDNMGSGIMVLEGPWDEASKSVTLKGKMMDPGTKEMTDMKEVFKVIDDNTQMMEMYVTMDGKEMKTMEIKSTRKK